VRTDLENLSEWENELNGTVRFRELLFQLALDLYGCLKLAGNCAHAVKAGVVTQQLSDGSFKGGQGLFHGPTLPHQPINAAIRFYLVHGNSFCRAVCRPVSKGSEALAEHKRAASCVDSQPLQMNLKVLQEQQTQPHYITASGRKPDLGFVFEIGIDRGQKFDRNHLACLPLDSE
jgi:hypothetical protein